MKYLTILSTLLISSFAAAQGPGGDGAAPVMGGGGHGGHGGSRGNQPMGEGQGGHGGRGRNRAKTPCDEFIHAERVLKTLANTTRLATIQEKNPQRYQKLQEQKANATAVIAANEKNATFVKECQVIEVQRDLKRACRQMRHLAQTAANVNNTNGARAKQRLEEMEKNQTLVADCKTIDAQRGAAGKGQGGQGGQGNAHAKALAGKSSIRSLGVKE
jgi:hypothetical protein